MKETRLQIRVDEYFKERLQQRAEQLGVTLSAYVKMTLKRALDTEEKWQLYK